MDASLILPALVVGLVVGLVAGWAIGRSRAAAAFASERIELAARAAGAEAARDGWRMQADSARAEQAARDERERREQTVLQALAPVRETLQTMQRTVSDLESDRQRQYGSLAEQLRRAQQSDEALRATTESLAGALRSGSARGVWGETQLRRVVEAAGLTRYVDFELQQTVATDAGAGRPDMVIRLPGEKSLAVDAKVPLDAYLEASAIPETAVGEEGARRRALRGRHVRAVRAHVDALAKKTYWAGLASSPEFVICFIPSESLLAAALEDDPALLEYAFGKRVALASPVSLWSVLKTIAYTWTQQDVSHEARQLLDLGTQLYERLGSLAGHADDLRRALERTVESYNRFVGSLETRVLVTARRFPGIDETKLDALPSPAPIQTAPRVLAAPELVLSEPAPSDPPTPLAADLGAVRDRLAATTGDDTAARREHDTTEPHEGDASASRQRVRSRPE